MLLNIERNLQANLISLALDLHLICFTPFWFNAPCQYTPLLYLHPLIFGLTPFVWPRSITLTSIYSIISYGNIIFYLGFIDLRQLFKEHN
jgi:hypothetical protein